MVAFHTQSLAIIMSLLVSTVCAYELEVEVEDLPMHQPLQKEGYIEEVWGSLDEWKKGDAMIYLNDNNFEHLTQATSGQTTGDWFILFGAPWCTYCDEMMLNWNHTARDLKGDVNVATIDASNNPFTAQRFNITGYPTLLLLHKGRAYEYKGHRYWKNFIVFARLEYEQAPSFEIPPAHGTFDEVVFNVQKYLNNLASLLDTNPLLFVASVICGIVFGCILPYGYILSAPLDPSFVDIKKTEYTGPKIWTKNGKSELPVVPEEGNESTKNGQSETKQSDVLAGEKVTAGEIEQDNLEKLTESKPPAARKGGKGKINKKKQ